MQIFEASLYCRLISQRNPGPRWDRNGRKRKPYFPIPIHMHISISLHKHGLKSIPHIISLSQPPFPTNQTSPSRPHISGVLPRPRHLNFAAVRLRPIRPSRWRLANACKFTKQPSNFLVINLRSRAGLTKPFETGGLTVVTVKSVRPDSKKARLPPLTEPSKPTLSVYQR